VEEAVTLFLADKKRRFGVRLAKPLPELPQGELYEFDAALDVMFAAADQDMEECSSIEDDNASDGGLSVLSLRDAFPVEYLFDGASSEAPLPARQGVVRFARQSPSQALHQSLPQPPASPQAPSHQSPVHQSSPQPMASYQSPPQLPASRQVPSQQSPPQLEHDTSSGSFSTMTCETPRNDSVCSSSTVSSEAARGDSVIRGGSYQDLPTRSQPSSPQAREISPQGPSSPPPTQADSQEQQPTQTNLKRMRSMADFMTMSQRGQKKAKKT